MKWTTFIYSEKFNVRPKNLDTSEGKSEEFRIEDVYVFIETHSECGNLIKWKDKVIVIKDLHIDWSRSIGIFENRNKSNHKISKFRKRNYFSMHQKTHSQKCDLNWDETRN